MCMRRRRKCSLTRTGESISHTYLELETKHLLKEWDVSFSPFSLPLFFFSLAFRHITVFTSFRIDAINDTMLLLYDLSYMLRVQYSGLAKANQAFHPSVVGEFLPDLSGKDKTLTCPSASLLRRIANAHSNTKIFTSRWIDHPEWISMVAFVF